MMTNTEIISVSAPIMAGLLGWIFVEVRKWFRQKRLERKRLLKTVLKLEHDVIQLQEDGERSEEIIKELKADLKEVISLLMNKSK